MHKYNIRKKNHDTQTVNFIESIHLIVGVTSHSWNCRGGSYFRMTFINDMFLTT